VAGTAAQGPPAAAERLPGDFWRLWAAAVVSRLGGGIASAAAPLLATTLTRDPRLIALVSVCAGLPWLLFALHTGALADRWDRRRVMWACDLVSAGVYTALAVAVLTGQAALWTLCAVAFAAATVSTLFDSASQAALPSLVPRGLLARANSRLYVGTVAAGLFAGPPLGSWLSTSVDWLPFALDAVSFVGSAALVVGIRARFSAAARGRTSLRQDIGEGVRWLWAHRQLRALVVLLTSWNLTESALISVLVLYALEDLALDASAYGVLLTGVAVGGVLGATAAPRVERRLGTGVVIALTVGATVAADLGLALTRRPVAAVALLAVVGAAAFAFNVVSVSYRQSVVPDGLQGRVSSTYRFATWGVNPVGAALGGVLARAAGTPAVFWAAAVVLALVGVGMLPALTNGRLATGAGVGGGAAREDGPGS
jgi:MFS family permease